MVNDSTIKAIRKLKDNNGQYLWQPSLAAGTPDMILGRPIKTSAYMPAMASGSEDHSPSVTFLITGLPIGRGVPSNA